MIGLQLRVTYVDPKSDPELLEVTQYALGRIAQWSRLSGVKGVSFDPDDMEGTTLWMQVAAWSEKTRGGNLLGRPEFDDWIAAVASVEFVGAEDVDPTQPATSGE